MDLNDVRSLVTLLSFLLFGALMAWTWWPRRRLEMEGAARLPFLGESLGEEPGQRDAAREDQGSPR